MTIKVAFVDLDGVINAVSNVRKHLIPAYTDRSSYWAEWHKAHVNEPINPAAVDMVRGLCDLGNHVVFLSSRQDTCATTTLQQLYRAFDGKLKQFGLSLRGPLDDTPPPQYKASAISHYLGGIALATRESKARIFIQVIDDSADVLTGIKNDYGISSFTKDSRLKLVLHHVATFTGEIK